MPRKKTSKSAKKKPRKKAKKKRAPAVKAKVTRAPAQRRRRAPRIRPRKGPIQMGLPLQMPLALGAGAFAERPVPASPDAHASDTPRAVVTGEQETLFE